MPGDPIIIDDGGSTRIKKKLPVGVGQMDTLLEVTSGVPTPTRSGSKHTAQAKPATGSYGTIRVSFIDSAGRAFDAVPPSTFTSFRIVSNLHEVSGQLIPDSGLMDLELTVHGPTASHPIVDAKQHNGQRRYIVTNTSPIDQVIVDGTTVYSAATPGMGTAPAIYTSVFIT